MIDDESEGGDCDEVMHARCGEPGGIFLVKSNPLGFLPAQRYASAGYSDRNVSVRLSVCPSVTRRYCVKTKKASGMISSPSGSPKTLVF